MKGGNIMKDIITFEKDCIILHGFDSLKKKCYVIVHSTGFFTLSNTPSASPNCDSLKYDIINDRIKDKPLVNLFEKLSCGQNYLMFVYLNEHYFLMERKPSKVELQTFMEESLK